MYLLLFPALALDDVYRLKSMMSMLVMQGTQTDTHKISFYDNILLSGCNTTITHNYNVGTVIR